MACRSVGRAWLSSQRRISKPVGDRTLADPETAQSFGRAAATEGRSKRCVTVVPANDTQPPCQFSSSQMLHGRVGRTVIPPTAVPNTGTEIGECVQGETLVGRKLGYGNGPIDSRRRTRGNKSDSSPERVR